MKVLRSPDTPIEVGNGVTIGFSETGIVVDGILPPGISEYRRALEEAVEVYGHAAFQEYRRKEVLEVLRDTYREVEKGNPSLTEEQVNAILARIDVSGFPVGNGLRITYVDGGMQVTLIGVPDTSTGRSVDVAFKMARQTLFTEDQVFAAARAALYASVIHEFQEHFRVDGELVDDPHDHYGGGDPIAHGLRGLCQAYVGALFR